MSCISQGSATLVADQPELYRRMWVLRLVDMALEEMRIEGLIKGPLQAGFGQEAVGIGATAALGEGDITVTTHCPHAKHVGIGVELGPMITDIVNQTGGQDVELDAQTPLLAVGHAYSQWLDNEGRVTLCAIKEQDVNSSVFNEAAKLAVMWQLPVVFLVGNVRCAPSARLDRHAPETQLHRRAASYGMPGVSVDGNDVVAVRDCVAEAVQRARAGRGPTLVQAVTYQSTDGSEQFVDPLVYTRRRLIAAGTAGGRIYDVERTARQLVAGAVAFAKARRPLEDGLSETASQ
jgi:acetoin:2,6-dichlorophenolindophenol oxidoreductase subunit alpha